MREFIIKFSDEDALSLVKGMPEAGNNELIRCKHCQFYERPLTENEEPWCLMWDSSTFPTGFCHNGVREENNDATN